jgi:rare lipoprotein A
MRNSVIFLTFLLPLHFHSSLALAEENRSSAKATDSAEKKKHLLKKPQKGKASYYGKEFYGKKMADGTKMDPAENHAASRTLPLGTEAKVTNMENGKSEIVEIRDRGPYVEGRIVDVSPSTAENLDFKKDGVVPVEVQPLKLPEDKNLKSEKSSSNNK